MPIYSIIKEVLQQTKNFDGVASQFQSQKIGELDIFQTAAADLIMADVQVLQHRKPKYAARNFIHSYISHFQCVQCSKRTKMFCLESLDKERVSIWNMSKSANRVSHCRRPNNSWSVCARVSPIVLVLDLSLPLSNIVEMVTARSEILFLDFTALGPH